MTEKERLMAFRWITKRSWYGIGIVNNRTIDQHNIYQATLIAMKKALVHLLALYPYSKPSAILVDAMPLTTGDTSYKDIPIYHFPKGERKSSSIAAASIVAKVTRDGLMDSFNEIFPGYRWHTNKGYATKAHRAAVQELNHTIVHRMRFLNNTIHIEDEDFNEQQSLLEMIENQEAESVELLKQTESPQILGINKHEENKEW